MVLKLKYFISCSRKKKLLMFSVCVPSMDTLMDLLNSAGFVCMFLFSECDLSPQSHQLKTTSKALICLFSYKHHLSAVTASADGSTRTTLTPPLHLPNFSTEQQGSTEASSGALNGLR